MNTRRVVLLPAGGGKDAPAERVLWEGPAGAEPAALRREAAAHPGRAVAAEHLRPASRGRPAAEWVRFLWFTVEVKSGENRDEGAGPGVAAAGRGVAQ